MSKRIQKLTWTSRRGMACAIAAALALSSLAPAHFAEAAGKKKPTLNVKKKTLYWNKPGNKNYTLKIKKNKVKTIVATTWKTSKKSVVALSKKKGTSVRLTAKKKGTATITAAVKYVPTGKWAIRTIKLTCRITSKGSAPAKTPPVNTEPAQTPLIIYTSMPAPPSKQPVVTNDPADTAEPDKTADPDGTPIPDETTAPDKSQEPASTPNTPDDSVVSEVVLNSSESLLGMEKGRNTIALTATAKDKDGNPLENPTVIWTSDNENVAAVNEGLVTAAGNGTAHITATVNNVTSKPCTVTVDAEKPFITKAELNDGRTFFVAFNEPVTGKPSVNVKTDNNTTIECASQTLSEDGTNMTITCQNVLSAGIYELTVNGLEDSAGNKMAKDSFISITKEASTPNGFLCKTEQAPAGQSFFDVYFSIVDQYGEKFDTLGIMSEGVLSASAQTETGMPFKTQVNQQEGYVRISGSASAFTEGRKIKITLSYSVLDQTIIEEEMTVTLADATNKGKAVKISGLNATSKTMEYETSADEVVFQLSSAQKDNVFTLSSKLLDEFGYKADPADVIYMIKDESILAFPGADETDTEGICTSKQPVSVQALKGGSTTITAYLASDDSQSFTIKITIKSTSLKKIAVTNPASGTNGRMTEAKVNLFPAGTGLTKDDLQFRVTEGKERVQKYEFVQENDGIYINITAFPDGRDEPIRFVVYSNEIESDEISYISTPDLTPTSIKIKGFEENSVTADGRATTTYQILNRYGEDITNRIPVQPACEISSKDVIKTAVTDTRENVGILTIETSNSGTAEITLSMDSDSSVNARVTVTVLPKAYVQEIRFGTASMNGLALGDPDILYIPVQAYDQYGNKFMSFTTNTILEEDLIVTIDGKSKDDCDFLTTEWYKQVGDSSPATLEIGVLGIKWNSSSSKSTIPTEGDILTIGLESKRTDFKVTPYKIPIKAASEIQKLEFGRQYQAAIPGAAVTNTVKLFDQYNTEITSLPTGQSLHISVVDNEGTSIDTTTTPTVISSAVSVSADSIITDVTPTNCQLQLSETLPPGEYTVRLHLGAEDSTYGKATVKGSYTLTVGMADTLLKKIEIYDTATNSKEMENQYVNLTSPGTTLTFDCKMYTKYQENETEIAWKNSLGKSVIDSSKLVWTAEAPDAITVEQNTENKNIFKFSSSSTDLIDDTVIVSLTYFSGKEDPIYGEQPIKVSNKPSQPQGEYRIVTYDTDTQIYGSEDYLSKDEPVEILKDTTFAFIAGDQYGGVYNETKLFMVTSSENDVVSVNTSAFPTNDCTFLLNVNPDAATGSTSTIKVYLTRERFYEFTVKIAATR